MNLYKIFHYSGATYDYFDSAIVVAETEEEARKIHPCGYADGYGWTLPENVQVRLLGKALPEIPKGVILASYNSG